MLNHRRRANPLSQTALLVRPPLRRGQVLLRCGLAGLLAAGIAALAFFVGQRDGLIAQAQQVQSHRDGENNNLSQSLGTTQTQLRVEEATRDSLSQQLQQLQTDNAGLREQLAFYEALLTKTDRAPGLSIDTFRSEKLSPGRYRLKIVLVQGQSSQGPFEGEVEFRLTTERNKRRDTLVWPNKRLPVRVSRFALVETELILANDALLQKADVRIFAKGESQSRLNRSFDVKE
jgi:hypothetical protein